MRSKLETFLTLCRCLSRNRTPEAVSALDADLTTGDIDWTGLAALANQHFLTPALWWSLDAKDLTSRLPPDLREFATRAYRLNKARNQRVRSEAIEMVSALNAIDVTPILLKGGVYLFENGGARMGRAMMLDLDLLVPSDRLEDCVERVRGLGHEIALDWPDWSYHYPPLYRAGDAASVEIHRDAGEQRSLLPSKTAFCDAEILQADGLRLYALSPTHRALHSIFNSAVQDRNHVLGLVPLKQLHDLALLCEARGKNIDWQAVHATMKRHGLASSFSGHIHLAQRLFDLQPSAAVRPTIGARAHYRRCLAQLARPGLSGLVGRIAALTHPFSRHRIDYLYGDTANPLRRGAHRLHRAWTLVWRHRGGFRRKFAEVHRGLYLSR